MIRIQAHRGASKERPENSMAAFQRAAERQADGIELDVHVLPDGTVAVHHDGRLGRCEEPQKSIYDYRRETIQSFSIGAKFSSQYSDERVPFLEQVLDLVSREGLFLNVEIKKDTGFSYTSYEDTVIDLLDRYHWREHCIISSFHHDILRSIKERHPGYRVGALYGETYGIDMIDYCAKYGFDALHPYFGFVDGDFVRRAHERQLLVNVWTVDQAPDIRRMMEAGVDTIITNDVETAQAVLAEYRP